MNTKLIIHIVISLISLSGLIVYYYAFLLGYKKHNSQLKKQSKLPEKLYFMSTYPALIWYVLPFIEQPRMHGIYDWLNGEFVFFNVLYIPVSFLLFVYFFGIWGKKSVSQNIEATKSAFYAPSKLLTEGIYARVQHPMIIGDILGHFSLVLLTGGIYTCILFPIYVFIDLFMIKIQVKYSLEPVLRFYAIPSLPIIINAIMDIIASLYTILLVKQLFNEFSIALYVKKVILPCFIVTLISLGSVYVNPKIISQSLLRLILGFVFNFSIIAFLLYFFILDINTKTLVNTKVKHFWGFINRR